MFDAVIFDLDGLLIDTESISLSAGPEACRALGFEVSPAFFETLVGIDDVTGFTMLSAHVGAPIDRDAINAEWDAACLRHFQKGIPLKPGVSDLLDHLDQRGTPRAIATSSTRPRATLKLSMSGLAARFTTVVSVDCIVNPKPAPDPYLHAAHLLGVDPRRCVAFDDSDTGVRSAHAAGMTVVQVPDIKPSSENLAHFTAQSLLDGARASGLLK